MAPSNNCNPNTNQPPVNNNQPPVNNNQPPPVNDQPPPNAIDINSPNNPLYLHPNDHPGMMIALNAKNKLKIVTGEMIEPTVESEERALWERTNDMIISWILNTISDQISNNLNFVNSASALWNEFIKVYYHKLKGLWDEHDALEAPYLCNCACSCENGKNNGDREQRKRLIQFLMGLDECYSNLRGQILLLQPLPLVAKAYGMVRQEEKQREDSKTQYDVLIRRFDTSYPTGGYGVSSDQSEQNTIENN
ncbi:hypothetical protein Tco_0126572 [Tanacetum coccineum]